MDVKYYKEQRRSYMVIRNTEDEGVISYQQKMLEIRKPAYILETSIRNIDGEQYGYYDITSRITLRQLFGGRTLDMQDISLLVESIKEVCGQVERYMLDEERLVFDPDMIFYSFGAKVYSFVYNVSASPEQDVGMHKLLDFLLENVSPEDSEASDYVYKVYDYSEKKNFDVWDVIALFPEDEQHEKTNARQEFGVAPDRDESNDTNTPAEGNAFLNDSLDYLDMVENNREQPTVKRTGLFVSIGGGVGLTACAIVFLVMKMSETEMLILAALAIISAAALAAGVVNMVKTGLRRKEDDEYENNLRKYVEDELVNNVSDLSADIKLEDIMPGQDKVTGRRKDIEKSMQQVNGGTDTENGQTVFFSSDPTGGNYKLYALDKKNKQHIELNRFPYTIGKMTGYVDCCLNHPSVSRLHARIEIRNNDLVLSDLNSTNGVFLNGIRLSPNEMTVIEEGDEIRIGSLNYCLRSCG